MVDRLVPVPQREFIRYKRTLKERFPVGNYIPTKQDKRKIIASELIESAGDAFASYAGFVAGYTGGFALGVVTKTNPMATAATGASIGATTFPWLIKGVVAPDLLSEPQGWV